MHGLIHVTRKNIIEKKKIFTSARGFEPLRANPLHYQIVINLVELIRVQRLNHSARLT